MVGLYTHEYTGYNEGFYYGGSLNHECKHKMNTLTSLNGDDKNKSDFGCCLVNGRNK